MDVKQHVYLLTLCDIKHHERRRRERASLLWDPTSELLSPYIFMHQGLPDLTLFFSLFFGGGGGGVGGRGGEGEYCQL